MAVRTAALLEDIRETERRQTLLDALRREEVRRIAVGRVPSAPIRTWDRFLGG